MTVPEPDARVEVTLHGEVVRTVERDGFWLRVSDGILNWVPAGASWTVLSPPRPSEVTLLECGHVQHQLCPAALVGETVYCWRFPCQNRKSVVAVGSVTW